MTRRERKREKDLASMGNDPGLLGLITPVEKLFPGNWFKRIGYSDYWIVTTNISAKGMRLCVKLSGPGEGMAKLLAMGEKVVPVEKPF